jgi:glutathione S-transferase
MKLYFAPGACSLSPHIVLREAEAKFDLEQVDLREKKTKKGDDYWKINPKGQVPLLELDDGQMISEGPAIVQSPGLAHPYRNRAAQDLRTDVPPNHPRRVQEDFQGDAREQVQEH